MKITPQVLHRITHKSVKHMDIEIKKEHTYSAIYCNLLGLGSVQIIGQIIPYALNTLQDKPNFALLSLEIFIIILVKAVFPVPPFFCVSPSVPNVCESFSNGLQKGLFYMVSNYKSS